MRTIAFFRDEKGTCPVEEYDSTTKAFERGFESGYEEFKSGEVLRRFRLERGLSQEELATRLQTKKTAISRIENHAGDIRLSTLERYARPISQQSPRRDGLQRRGPAA